MNALAKCKRETGRLLRERTTWLVMALTLAGTVWFSLNGTGRTAADAYLIGPAQNSAFLGALLFSALTLAQFHRDYKNHTDAIILASADPVWRQVRRTLALLCAAALTAALVSLFALPFGMVRTGAYFQWATFLTAWWLIFLWALVFSVLLSSGLYMFTGRVEAAALLMLGLILLSGRLESMYTLNPSYLLYWVQTTAKSFSDLITNRFQLDLLLYNRLFCLLASAAVWALGLCSLRRYGRGLAGSFLTNCRRVWLPGLLAAALSLSAVSYAFEPIFDDSRPMDFSGIVSSGTGTTVYYGGEPEVGNPALTLTGKTFALEIDNRGRTLSGTARYTLENAGGEAQTLPVQLNTGLRIESARVNGAESKALRGETGENSVANWTVALPAGTGYEVELTYSGRMGNDNTILQRASNGISEGYVWLPTAGVSPSLDISKSETGTLSGTVTLDEGLEPVFSNGTAEKERSAGGPSLWRFTGAEGAQGTSLFAADYMTRSFEAGGLDIELKYFAKHDWSITDMDAVSVIQAAINYFTEIYGPLIYSERLTMLELPAYVSGGFAGGNMSAMDETSFAAEGYLPAESVSPDSGGGIDVLVHEIAHQWWGLAAMPMQDGVSNWSAEGITCYSTYSFMRQYFGEDYAREHFVKGWEESWETYQNAFYIQHPEYLGKLSEADVSNILGSFTNMRLYDLMPLMLLKGEEALGGPEAFQAKLAQLYQSHLGQLVLYEDFLNATGLTEEAMKLA